jgi:glycosyltransferase involved in cell wall biosynthesis
MKVSIIIPVYNTEQYLPRCIDSILGQSFTDFELLLIDDGSTDGSAKICDAYAEKDSRIRVLHKENGGVSSARNLGLNEAKGEWVVFVDSDDWISDNCIKLLTEPLRNKEFDIVVGDYRIIGEFPYNLELSLPEGAYHETGITHTFCNGGIYIMSWNKLYRKEFLLKNQLAFEEGKVHEDEILAFEISCLEKSFYVVKSVTYYYRIRENSIATIKDRHLKLQRYIAVFQSIKEKVKRYKKVDGIYDHYLFFIRRVFRWISWLDLDEELIRFADEQTEGFLEEIPSLFSMREKSNRLAYFACKNKQTYSRFHYVTEVYANKVQGRMMRTVLSLFPYKRVN